MVRCTQVVVRGTQVHMDGRGYGWAWLGAQVHMDGRG